MQVSIKIMFHQEIIRKEGIKLLEMNKQLRNALSFEQSFAFSPKLFVMKNDEV